MRTIFTHYEPACNLVLFWWWIRVRTTKLAVLSFSTARRCSNSCYSQRGMTPPIPLHPLIQQKAHNVLFLKRSKHIAILLLSTSLYQECKRLTNQFLMSMNTSLYHCIFFQIPERMNMSENASLQCWPESTPLQTTKLAVLSTIFFLTLVSNVLILVAILSLKQKVNSFFIKILIEGAQPSSFKWPRGRNWTCLKFKLMPLPL